MAIRDTYAELITEEIIRELLLEGTSPSVSTITNRFNDFVDDNDISKPLLNLSSSKVSEGDSSSAALFNNTMSQIQQDLKVIYRHLFKTSEASIFRFHRWRAESEILAGRLKALEERISSLLLLSNDTAGYFNFVQDNFVDTSKTDLTETTAYVNTNKGIVTLASSSLGATRIDLSSLENKDVVFTVLSRNNLVSTVSSSNSQRKYVVSDVSNYWQERVYLNKPSSLSVELKIDLLSTQTISRIDIDLHMSNQNSTVQLTPMYSTDNYSWRQLSVGNPTRSVLDKTTFQFSEIQARYIKFIMTKPGFDQVHNELYSYEFGVDEIAFFREGFSTTTQGVFISDPLFVKGTDGNPEEFSRIALEVCEDIPTGTTIDYSVATSISSSMPAAGFVGIDPLGRTQTTQPTVLDFGDLDIAEISDIGVSYTPTDSLSFINPSRHFTYLSSVVGGTPVTQSGQASAVRYAFKNSDDRILDLQIASGVRIAQNSLELWRNINTKNDNTQVRGIANGWGFSEPYYTTTVYVENADGYLVDFGGQTVVVDGSPLSGKIRFTQGKHKVSVHKNQWKEVDFTTVSGENSLRSVDKLYPYNHRYLVEGMEFPGAWPTADKKTYSGFDIVAEYLAKEVSVFDLVHNVLSNDYSKFAIDEDTIDNSRLLDGSAASDVYPTKVFLLKVDGSNSDFQNEKFLLRFKSANSLFKYLRFKAVLETSDSNLAPSLDSYRIKVSS